MASASVVVRQNGFSETTCLPACNICIEMDACVLGGVETITRSMLSSRATSSMSVQVEILGNDCCARASRSSLRSQTRAYSRPGTASRAVPCSKPIAPRSEEHTSELQSRQYLECRLLLEKKNH